MSMKAIALRIMMERPNPQLLTKAPVPYVSAAARSAGRGVRIRVVVPPCAFPVEQSKISDFQSPLPLQGTGALVRRLGHFLT